MVRKQATEIKFFNVMMTFSRTLEGTTYNGNYQPYYLKCREQNNDSHRQGNQIILVRPRPSRISHFILGSSSVPGNLGYLTGAVTVLKESQVPGSLLRHCQVGLTCHLNTGPDQSNNTRKGHVKYEVWKERGRIFIL